MGLTPGSDYTPGSFCARCWGPAFSVTMGLGYLVSPKYVQATFSGVIACPGGVNISGDWLLTQTVIPCLWVYSDATWTISYYASDTFGLGKISQLAADNIAVGKTAFNKITTECTTAFANGLVVGDCSAVIGGHSGNGLITWGPGIHP